MGVRREAKEVAIESFDDVKYIVECLKEGESVIADFGEIPIDAGRRLLDFLSGAAFALKGTVNSLKNKKFILIPRGVKVSRAKK